METYRNKLQQLKQIQVNKSNPVKLIWDDIDAEVRPMTEEQKKKNV